MRPLLLLLWMGLSAGLTLPMAIAAQKPRIPVLIDTDIGSDIDDAFALALALASPELEVRGLTTVGGDTAARARMVCRLLAAVGRQNIPVAAGVPNRPQESLDKNQMKYLYMSGLAKREPTPLREGAVAFLYRQLKAQPGKITLVAIGPLSNLAQLLTEHPDCKPWIKRIVLMGGAVRIGYKGKPPAVPEFNIHADIKAAQVVFTSGVPLTVAPLDATTMLRLEDKMVQRFFSAGTPLTAQVKELYELWHRKEAAVLYDPVAVTLCFNESFCKMEEMHLRVDNKGFTRFGQGKPNARVAVSIRKDDFLRWYVDRLTSGDPRALPRKHRTTGFPQVNPLGF